MIHDCQQNSEEWLQLHVGRLTASSFHKFVTPGKLTLSRSQTARRYIVSKAMETITGRPERQIEARPMRHGHETEPVARHLYERLTNREVTLVGFATLDSEPLIGCSPDGLVGDDGGVELKCHWTQAEAGLIRLDGIPPEHYMQVIGTLWITGREWWDYMSYLDTEVCPDLRASVHAIRVRRDEKAIAKIESAVFAARDWLLETIEKIKENTCIPTRN